MSNTRVVRAGGFALLAGSIAFIVHVVLRSVATAGTDPLVVARASFWVPLHVLGLVGAVLVLLGLPAVSPHLASAGGRASALGLSLVAASWLFFGLFLSFYALLVLPWLAARAPWLVSPGAPLPIAFVVTFALALLSWINDGALYYEPRQVQIFERKDAEQRAGATRQHDCVAGHATAEHFDGAHRSSFVPTFSHRADRQHRRARHRRHSTEGNRIRSHPTSVSHSCDETTI